jgi:hypothetical protein
MQFKNPIVSILVYNRALVNIKSSKRNVFQYFIRTLHLSFTSCTEFEFWNNNF